MKVQSGTPLIRERILQAATIEFDRHGYAGARVQLIADRAGLSKSNLLYHFANKEQLYRSVLEMVLQRWNSLFDQIDIDSDPAEALEVYIRQKLTLSRNYPEASRIFSAELLHGAQFLKEYLETNLRSWIELRADIFQHWIKQGKISAVDPYHLIFMIWSTTQHYADYAVQIAAMMGRDELTDDDFEVAAQTLVTVILKGVGL